MTRYILSIDQGTTSSRAIVFNEKGLPMATAQKEFHQIFPEDGWVEHDPEEIWSGVVEVCRQAISNANLTAKEIAGIGITNQRETTVVWDAATGEAVYNAIVWQDRRTADTCRTLKDRGLEETFSSKTGLLLDPYFSATKIAWILDHVDDGRNRANKGELLFGTIDSFLLWRLTRGKSHKTDATNAARTLLFNITSQQWDHELLDILDIPEAMLPEVCDCSCEFGVSERSILGAAIPITGIAGDQQAALIGQACFAPGSAKSTYGTGCFMILNTGKDRVTSDNKLLTTIGYRLNGETTYALEGSIFIAGAAIQWLRDGLKLIEDANQTEALAEQANPMSKVYLVPAFTGLGAPYWDPNARGALLGLTRDTGIAEVVAAGLRSVCYQTKDLFEAMKADGATLSGQLRVDGGMVNNNWVVQFLADILDATVDRPHVTETTALGAAYLAGLHLGIFDSLDDITELWRSEHSFSPRMSSSDRDQLYSGWLAAVERVRSE